jgi:hypothetical protein
LHRGNTTRDKTMRKKIILILLISTVFLVSGCVNTRTSKLDKLKNIPGLGQEYYAAGIRSCKEGNSKQALKWFNRAKSVNYYKANTAISNIRFNCSGMDSSEPVYAEAYKALVPYSMSGSSYEINDSIKSYINKRKPASSRFIREVRKIKFVDDWLDKDSDKSKAIFAIDPQSCKDSYRYSSWNFRTDLAAIDRAKKGCDKAATKTNQKLGKDCKCRLVALNDTFFYGANTYKQHTGSFPWVMEVAEGEQTIKISGMVNLIGDRQERFDLVNDSGRKVCSGRFDFGEGGSEGDISLSCFDGRINGDGKVLRVEYNKDLRMYSGTALIKTKKGEMRVVYGPNALKIK